MSVHKQRDYQDFKDRRETTSTSSNGHPLLQGQEGQKAKSITEKG